MAARSRSCRVTGAVEVMPTDGVSTVSAPRATTGNVLTTSAYGGTFQNAPGAIVAGDLILLSTGYWGQVKVTPTTTAVAVRRWWRAGAGGGEAKDTVPEATGTYRVFPGSCLMEGVGGWKITKANLDFTAAASWTLKGPTGATFLTITSAVAFTGLLDFGDGVPVNGPFTITPSGATALGELEFELA